MRTCNVSTKQPPLAGPSSLALLLMLGPLLPGCSAPQGSIGALLVLDPGGALLVREAPEGMSGAAAGLQPGDEVVAIDGADVRGADRAEIHRRLKGPLGTRVQLTVVRDGSLQTLSVLRAPYRKR